MTNMAVSVTIISCLVSCLLLSTVVVELGTKLDFHVIKKKLSSASDQNVESWAESSDTDLIYINIWEVMSNACLGTCCLSLANPESTNLMHW